MIAIIIMNSKKRFKIKSKISFDDQNHRPYTCSRSYGHFYIIQIELLHFKVPDDPITKSFVYEMSPSIEEHICFDFSLYMICAHLNTLRIPRKIG